MTWYLQDFAFALALSSLLVGLLGAIWGSTRAFYTARRNGSSYHPRPYRVDEWDRWQWTLNVLWVVGLIGFIVSLFMASATGWAAI